MGDREMTGIGCKTKKREERCNIKEDNKEELGACLLLGAYLKGVEAGLSLDSSYYVFLSVLTHNTMRWRSRTRTYPNN